MIVAELFAKLGLLPDESSFERGTRLIEGVKLAFEAYIGYEAVKSVLELVHSTEELALHAKKTSQELGVSTAAIQELGYAAEITDLSQQEMETSLRKLSRSITNLRSGSGEASKMFTQLGLSAKDFEGESVDQNLEAIAEKFKTMPDGAKKTALAMQLFGRSGAAMIPLLNRGKEGIAGLRNEFVELGGEIDDEAIESFEEFHAQTVRLSTVWRGFKNQIAIALLPTIKAIVDNLVQWVKVNKGLIQERLETVVEALTLAFNLLGYGVKAALVVMGFFLDHTELAKSALIALGVVLAAFAIQAAIAWISATWPILAVIAVVFLLVLAIRDVYKSLTTGHGKAADIWRRLRDGAKSFADFVKSIPDDIVAAFETMGEGIKKTFLDVLAWLEKKVKEFPVVKQVLDAANFVGLGGSSGGPASVPVAPTLSLGNGQTLTINQGDTHIAVDATNTDTRTDWEKKSADISRMLDERDAAANRKTAAAVSGGKPP